MNCVIFLGFIVRVIGHYPNQYFAHQSHSVFHNVGGTLGFGIPALSGHFHSPVPAFHFPHNHLGHGHGHSHGHQGHSHDHFHQWLGKPAVANDFIPNELKPSIVGWNTNYNVPCGTYTIHPFVVARLRYQSGGSGRGLGGHHHHHQHHFPKAGTRNRQDRSLYHHPNFGVDIGSGSPKTCSWQFHSFADCKLKFTCSWFQLPALFKCEENYLELSDGLTSNYTFCGSRRPRGPYGSTTKLFSLTFKSESSALPAVFDCTISCGLDAFNYGAQNNGSAQSIKLTNALGSPTKISGVQPKRRTVPCTCGQQMEPSSTSRIVGGSAALPGEFPWVAALVTRNTLQPFCGGNLINDRYIVTAAHCVQKRGYQHEVDPIEILLNEHDISSTNRLTRLQISGIIIHPRYNHSTYDYDIALLRLKDPVTISENRKQEQSQGRSYVISSTSPEPEPANSLADIITPICLHKAGKNSLQDQLAIVTGWGLTKEGGMPSKTMLQASVQIFNDTSCQQFYRATNTVTRRMLCAGHSAGKMDSCVGDSGGPLIVSQEGRYILAGIVSWGRGCARPNLPGVYTRIEGLTEWIELNASEDSNWCAE